MNVFDLARLLLLAIFGIIISIKDFRERKIYNRHILLMAGLGASLFLLESGSTNIIKYGVNFALSFLVGFGFWKAGFWNPGDGKLFAACSLFFPTSFYSSWFPTQVMIFNFFILAFFRWLPSLIWNTSREEKISAFKTVLQPKRILNLVLLVVGFFWIFGKFLQLIGVSIYIFTLGIAITIFYLLNKYFEQKEIFIILGIIAVARFIYSPIISLTGIINLLLTISVLLLVFGAGKLALKISSTLKYEHQIEVGDVPTDLVIDKNAENKDLSLREFLSEKFENPEQIISKGFSEKNIKKMKKTVEEKKGGFPEISGFLVKKYIPFAPLFFIATGITFFLGPNLDVLTSIVGGLYYVLLH